MIETFKSVLSKVRKRPALFIFISVVTLLLCTLEQFNPLSKNYGTLGALFSSDYLARLNTLAERIGLMLRNPTLLLLLFFMMLLLLVAISAMLGITYSGFFHQMLCASEEKPYMKGEFRTGISRHAAKLARYFLLAIPATVLFVIFILYTLVPAILSVKLFFTGSSSIFFPMLLICMLTILVDFVAILFYTMYVTFTVPALICFRKRSFGIACKMVNAYCWYLLPRTLLFLVANVGLRLLLWCIHYGLGSGVLSILVLILTWAIRICIDFLYLNFAFNTFSAMKGDMFDAQV